MVCEKWQASIVKVDKTMAMVLLVINIFFPGIGTMINACMGSGGMVTDQIIVGLLQFFTAWLLIGWIWAIWWGIIMVQKA